MRRSHAHLYGAERVLDRFPPRTHCIGILVEPLLDLIDDSLVLPSVNAPLFSSRAFRFQGARAASICPIASEFLPFLLLRIMIFQCLAGRAAISILLGFVDEVLLAETAFRLRSGGHRLWQRH